MIRMLIKIIACTCIAVVLAEAGGVFVMWKRGLLSDHNIREIKLVLNATNQQADPESAATRANNQPSMSEVVRDRALRLFEFDRREGQLQAMKTMANDQAADLEQRLQEFRAHKKAFEEGLETLQKSISTQGSEQARGVLLAMPPREAVEKLMILSLQENVLLMKGMSEKSIAKILAEFSANPEQIERGRKIFEAISRGDPARTYVNDEANRAVIDAKPISASSNRPPSGSPPVETGLRNKDPGR